MDNLGAEMDKADKTIVYILGIWLSSWNIYFCFSACLLSSAPMTINNIEY